MQSQYSLLLCHGKRKQVQFKGKMTYRYHFGSRSKSNTIDYINSYYCMWFWRKSKGRKKHVQVVAYWNIPRQKEASPSSTGKFHGKKKQVHMRMHQPIVRVNSDRFSGLSCFFRIFL